MLFISRTSASLVLQGIQFPWYDHVTGCRSRSRALCSLHKDILLQLLYGCCFSRMWHLPVLLVLLHNKRGNGHSFLFYLSNKIFVFNQNISMVTTVGIKSLLGSFRSIVNHKLLINSHHLVWIWETEF